MEASIPDAAKAAEQTAAPEPKAPGEERTPADAAVEALPDEEPAAEVLPDEESPVEALPDEESPAEASPAEAFPDEDPPGEAHSAVEVSTDAALASAAPAAEASLASEAKQFVAEPAAPGDHHVPAPNALPASNL